MQVEKEFNYDTALCRDDVNLAAKMDHQIENHRIHFDGLQSHLLKRCKGAIHQSELGAAMNQRRVHNLEHPKRHNMFVPT